MLSPVQVNRPEDELLLCCARTSRSLKVAIRIETLLRQDMDWEYLLLAAGSHGVAPLLYWHLNATCPEAVPEDTLNLLREHFRANGLRNLSLTAELLKLLNVFEARGIPAVPYKGPALAASVYGNLALREFADLDILVHRTDVLRAKETLTSMGYQVRYQLTPAQEAAFLRSQCEHPFERDGESIVELHWGITDRHFFPLDTEHFWEHIERVPLGESTVLNFSPEDMLLILCIHGARHVWERLGWICDVAELIRARRDIRWEWVIARAKAMGSERMLLLGLFLASDLLGAVLPERVSQRVQADPAVVALAEQVCGQLFRETGGLAGLLKGRDEAPAFHPLHLKVRERLRDKIRYCVLKATAMRGEDWELLSLPRFLFPLHFVVRPIRLARKYGLRVLKRLL